MIGVLSLPIGSVLTGQPEVIGSSVLAAAAASVRFDFPLVYRAVLVDGYIKRDGNNASTLIRLNGDTGTNYSSQQISANATSVAGARFTGRPSAEIAGSATLANQPQSFSLLIIKTTAGAKAQIVNQTGYNTTLILELTGHEWNNAADLLSRVDVVSASNNFAANTSITLWGFRR